MTLPGASSAERRARLDLLYGRNSVTEALRGNRVVHRVLAARDTHGLDPLLAEARRFSVPVELVERARLDGVLRGAHHQGVAAEAEPFAYAHLTEALGAAEMRGEPPLLLVLDSLQDPQNFGTLLRTAQACGMHGAIIPEHRAVGVTPAVSNASAGAVEHLRVVQVTNLARTLGDLKSRGVWIYGLAPGATRPYYDQDLGGPIALVVGSEGSGLGRVVREACDVLVSIPMADGAIQSLNASVAGSLVVYEAFRRRRSQ